ncbi:hypothetical protein DMP23_42870 [Amycolatopsis sp. A1MSW2902]|uniref:hypothetical protein n=1 Tax=Amycolatopsis sp. A1MSW2902 TaxID=687413 RepID=UPI00307CF147
MGRRGSLCECHTPGASLFGEGLGIGGYLAAAECAQLPPARHRDERDVVRGWAVGIGQWFFFSAPEPAAAFGRAARMSSECSGYGVYEAARETRFCETHGTDEAVLLVNPQASLLTRGDEHQLALLARFVQGIEQRPASAHWHHPADPSEPTGGGCHATLDNGRPCPKNPRASGLCHIHDPAFRCGAPTLTGGRCTMPTGGGACYHHA